MPPSNDKKRDRKPVSLKVLSEYLDLSPATISIVLNDAPRAKSISAPARARILAAAKLMDYRPNTIARSLRMRQTFTIGVIAPELSEGYFTMVMNGINQCLMDAGYIYFVLCHQGRADLIEEYPKLLVNRGVDGLLLVNTTLTETIGQPVISISGHKKLSGVTNIMLDHDHAAKLALKHLRDLGHKRIVFMRGRSEIPDADVRWNSLMSVARKMGVAVYPELCVQLQHTTWSPELGSPIIRELLARTRNFTAVFCFNDIAAVGTVRALADAGLSCPGDVSVMGFDDIAIAMYQVPSLTTIRQPLHRMGETGAQMLLKRIQNAHEDYLDQVLFEPELMVRESTGAARRKVAQRKRVAPFAMPDAAGSKQAKTRSDAVEKAKRHPKGSS
jgi:DNA-binding LacI/PurR family transcriptional regulator